MSVEIRINERPGEVFDLDESGRIMHQPQRNQLARPSSYRGVLLARVRAWILSVAARIWRRQHVPRALSLPGPCGRCGQAGPHAIGDLCDGIVVLPIPGDGMRCRR